MVLADFVPIAAGYVIKPERCLGRANLGEVFLNRSRSRRSAFSASRLLALLRRAVKAMTSPPEVVSVDR